MLVYGQIDTFDVNSLSFSFSKRLKKPTLISIKVGL